MHMQQVQHAQDVVRSIIWGRDEQKDTPRMIKKNDFTEPLLVHNHLLSLTGRAEQIPLLCLAAFTVVTVEHIVCRVHGHREKLVVMRKLDVLKEFIPSQYWVPDDDMAARFRELNESMTEQTCRVSGCSERTHQWTTVLHIPPLLAIDCMRQSTAREAIQDQVIRAIERNETAVLGVPPQQPMLPAKDAAPGMRQAVTLNPVLSSNALPVPAVAAIPTRSTATGPAVETPRTYEALATIQYKASHYTTRGVIHWPTLGERVCVYDGMEWIDQPGGIRGKVRLSVEPLLTPNDDTVTVFYRDSSAKLNVTAFRGLKHGESVTVSHNDAVVANAQLILVTDSARSAFVRISSLVTADASALRLPTPICSPGPQPKHVIATLGDALGHIVRWPFENISAQRPDSSASAPIRLSRPEALRAPAHNSISDTVPMDADVPPQCADPKQRTEKRVREESDDATGTIAPGHVVLLCTVTIRAHIAIAAAKRVKLNPTDATDDLHQPGMTEVQSLDRLPYRRLR